MKGATQHWYVYGQTGQASYLFGPQEKQAHKTRLSYESIYPQTGPYLVVVYFVNKVDGTLMTGTLDDNSPKQEWFQDEAS